MDLNKASIKQIADAVKTKKITALQVTQFFLKRIELCNPQLNAFITVSETAIQEAQELDRKIQQGQAFGRLAGVPIAIKDMLCTRGLRTTAASKMLENFIPPYDATVVARLKAEGAIIIGKTNQDEFAMGSSNETSYFKTTKNPWNTQFVTGGSSGGGAAAQASRLCVGSIGTDTGGSIRQPASFCGVVGVKPTYGRASRYGIIAYASSLDQAGPFANTVEDAALLTEVICGYDWRDSTSATHAVPHFSENINANMAGKKIGIIKEFASTSSLDPEVSKAFALACDSLSKAGAKIVEISIPLAAQAIPVYYLVAASEASSNLSRYDGVKFGYRKQYQNLQSVSLDDFYCDNRGEGFGTEVKRRILIGTFCLSSGYFDAYYKKASQVRRLLQQQFLLAFESCDALISPVSATPAFKIGEKVSDPLAMYLNDLFTVSTNLAGLPAASVPFGLSSKGLPIGIQVTANLFAEQAMLDVAKALEESSLVKNEVPNVY